MATTMVSEKTGSEDFSVEELYELQRRRGRVKPPAIAYRQRNVLKSKLRRSDNVFTLSIRSIGRFLSTAWRVFTYNPWKNAFDWTYLQRELRNPASRYDDILSGRSRFERMNKPAAANWGPLDRNRVYDPYQGTMTRTHK
jgi:hypothetical protein